MLTRLTRLLMLGMLAATTACSALVAAPGPTPTATLTVLPTPVPSQTPTAAPPADQATPAFNHPRPPTAELHIGGQEQVSAIGTYCWTGLDDNSTAVGLCVDMLGIMTPREPLVLPAGPFTAEFSLPVNLPPTTVALWVYPATGDPSPNADTDTLAWQPLLEAQSPVTAGVTSTATLDLAPGLYIVALFAQWQHIGDVMYGFLVQVGDPAATAEPSELVLPVSCTATSATELAYVDPGGRYCLLYPANFRTGDLTPERANFYGPPLDDSVEPVFAALTIETLGSAGGKSLAAVVEAYWLSQTPPYSDIASAPIQWGGQPAEVIHDLPGLVPTRQVIVIHGGTVYHIVLLPYDVTAPPALPDVENVWAMVSQSFAFLGLP